MRSEQTERRTLEMVRAGLQLSLRMSKQTTPWKWYKNAISNECSNKWTNVQQTKNDQRNERSIVGTLGNQMFEWNSMKKRMNEQTNERRNGALRNECTNAKRMSVRAHARTNVRTHEHNANARTHARKEERMIARTSNVRTALARKLHFNINHWPGCWYYSGIFWCGKIPVNKNNTEHSKSCNRVHLKNNDPL